MVSSSSSFWVNYLENFCHEQRERINNGVDSDNEWNLLPESTQMFLGHLDLPRLHPFCAMNHDDMQTTNNPLPFLFPAAPPMGPPPSLLTSYSNSSSSSSSVEVWTNLFSHINLFWIVYVHPTLVLMHVWAQILAGYLAPIGVLYIVISSYRRHCSYMKYPQQHEDGNTAKHNTRSFKARASYIATLYLSWIIFTDDQYILEFGRAYGAILVTATIGAALVDHQLVWGERYAKECSSCYSWRWKERKYHCALPVALIRRAPPPPTLFLASILFLLVVYPPWVLHDPSVFPLIPPGIYTNPKSSKIQNIFDVGGWKPPDYSAIATPWQFTGDTRTGFPYLFNNRHLKKLKTPGIPTSADPGAATTVQSTATPGTSTSPVFFHRVWLETDDYEYVALDIAFPVDGHDSSKPLYLVLHGLNGGSEEGYVADLATSRTNEGSTVVVMVARGLMDTPILGWTFFHGARISDAHRAAATLRERVLAPNQPLAGVGYSLGAIVLNHYVAVYSDQVALDVAVSISGALYCVPQKDFMRSQRTWQVLIAAFMKETFMMGKWGARLYHQLGEENYRKLHRVSTIVDIDRYVGVFYNGYSSLTEFYRGMSAIDPFSDRHVPDSGISITTPPRHNNHDGHQHNGAIAIPHLVLQAFDDPLSIWTTNADNDPHNPLYPWNLVTQQENLVLMLTSTGGHVGWPIGMFPNSWEFMNDFVAAGFVDAYHQASLASPPSPASSPPFLSGSTNHTVSSGHGESTMIAASADIIRNSTSRLDLSSNITMHHYVGSQKNASQSSINNENGDTDYCQSEFYVNPDASLFPRSLPRHVHTGPKTQN